MSYVSNPQFANSLVRLADSFMGDPEREARAMAAIAQTQAANARAALDSQTFSGRDRAAGAFTGDGGYEDVVRQLFSGYAMQGADLADAAPGAATYASLPSVRAVLDDQAFTDALVATGTQRYGDPQQGVGETLANNLARQRISSGAAVRAAEIRAAQSGANNEANIAAAAAAAANALVPGVDPETNTTILIPTGEAQGRMAPVNLNGARGAIVASNADDIVGGVAPEAVMEMAGALVPDAAAPTIDANRRTQFEMAFEDLTADQDANPRLRVEALAAIQELMAEGVPFEQAMLEVFKRIKAPVNEGIIYDTTGPLELGIGGDAPPPGFVVR